jgi:hypothetical protein
MMENGFWFLQGASCLLDWAEWSGALENRRVLELGSGLGQVSTLLLKTQKRESSCLLFHILKSKKLHNTPEFRRLDHSVLTQYALSKVFSTLWLLRGKVSLYVYRL